jgi:triphosphoribosyl-dephospho-CoA synthase
MPTTPADVALLAQLACLLEASAPKPGNVSPGRPFRDARYEDFLVSALAIGPALAEAAEHPLGKTIRSAVEATVCWTGSNTNLGLILMMVPLAQAVRVPGDRPLRARLAEVLGATTVRDAEDVYAAIRLASPGGLGRVESQDVSGPPTVNLLEAMRLAAQRDAIAREYVTDFRITFELGAPALRQARRDGLAWEDATVEAFLAILSTEPDTLIARKRGAAAAASASRKAAEVARAGGVRTAAGRRALGEFDAELRSEHNSLNPGTTADLTAAALFVELVERRLQGAAEGTGEPGNER